MAGNRTTSQELVSEEAPSLPSHVAGGRPMGCSGRPVTFPIMVPIPTVVGKGLVFLTPLNSPEPSNADIVVGEQTGDAELRCAEVLYSKGSHGAIVKGAFRQEE